jgi:hypothetical protein
MFGTSSLVTHMGHRPLARIELTSWDVSWRAQGLPALQGIVLA